MSSADDITVRLVSAEEAPSLTSLIRRCYGESYIDPTFYDPDVVCERLRIGQLCSIGAFDDSEELIGHMAITTRRHGGITADAGMTLVDPDHRGLGIARRVAAGLAKQAMAMGLVGVHDYPVTVHGATQRIGRGFGVDTGLMLANLPADVVFEEMNAPSAPARTSSLIRWIPFRQSPVRTVYLPTRYRDQIESLYSSCHLERRAEIVTDAAQTESALTTSYDERRQIVRIDVHAVGTDLALRVEHELDLASREDAAVAHLDLRLGDQGSPDAVAALRELGFFFAGLLPEYADCDVLRLQRLGEAVEVAAADVIASDTTRAIETFVFEDRP